MGELLGPKLPHPLPTVNPDDTANRIGAQMANKLQAGGTNADMTSANTFAPVGQGRAPTLTGVQ